MPLTKYNAKAAMQKRHINIAHIRENISITQSFNFAANIRFFSETSKGISLFLQVDGTMVVDDGNQYRLVAAAGALDADEAALVRTQRREGEGQIDTLIAQGYFPGLTYLLYITRA